jgi:ABC-2 type transport system permease protein
VFAIGIAALGSGSSCRFSPLVASAFVLVVLTASCVGYAIASLAPPTLTTILTQALVVFVLTFSPLDVPDRLPDWLRTVHAFLPIQVTGEVIRGNLASTPFTMTGGSSGLLVA